MDTQSLAIKQDYICNAASAIEATTTDPRAANCRGFLVDQAGKVVGIQLVHVPIPSAPYALVAAEMLDEYQAQGNTVVRSSRWTPKGSRRLNGYSWVGRFRFGRSRIASRAGQHR